MLLSALAWPKCSFAAASSRSISEFGVEANSDADQTANLQAAFDWLAMTRSTLILDTGARYQYSGTLEIRGGTLLGNGASLIARNAKKSCIYVRGENVSVSDLKIISNAQSRSQAYDAVGMMVIGARKFQVRNISIYGVACGGLGVDGSYDGDITGIEVRSSFADGFHITNGSNNIRVNNYRCFDTGDDGFAIVTYDNKSPDISITRNITARNLSITRSNARGVALVGAADVMIEGLIVEESACAGIYMNSEFSYGTYGNEQVTIRNAELINCVTRKGIDQGCVHIQGRTKLRDNSRFNSLKNYATRNARILDVIINGMGPGARAAVIVSQNAEQIEVSARVQTSGSPRKPFICDLKNPSEVGIHVSVTPI